MTPDRKQTTSQLVEYLDTAVLWISPELKCLYANPAAEMLLDESANRLRAKPITAIFKNGSELTQLLKHSHESELSVTRREFNLMLANGKATTLNLTINFVFQVGLIVELQSLGRAYAIHRERKMQSDHAAAQNLVRGLAHEIKNPLGGIRGAAQLLQSELKNQPALEEYTDVLIKEADRLTALINQLSGPRSRPNKATVNIHEITERALKLIQVEASNKIKIYSVYDPSLPNIFADKDQLIQATLNIARNALESIEQSEATHTPLEQPFKIVFRTSIMRKFTIGQHIYPLVISLKIEDNGPGIPEPLQPQIFFPMVTDKPTGTGLGLPTSRTLVDAQGGIIRFSSEPENTKFEILIPAAE